MRPMERGSEGGPNEKALFRQSKNVLVTDCGDDGRNFEENAEKSPVIPPLTLQLGREGNLRGSRDDIELGPFPSAGRRDERARGKANLASKGAKRHVHFRILDRGRKCGAVVHSRAIQERTWQHRIVACR